MYAFGSPSSPNVHFFVGTEFHIKVSVGECVVKFKFADIFQFSFAYLSSFFGFFLPYPFRCFHFLVNKTTRKQGFFNAAGTLSNKNVILTKCTSNSNNNNYSNYYNDHTTKNCRTMNNDAHSN